MNQRAARRFAVPVLVAIVAVLLFSARASTAGVESVWVGERTAAVQVASATGQRLSRLTQLRDVRAVAIDERMERLWAYSAHSLVQVTLEGAIERSTALPAVPGLGTLGVPPLPRPLDPEVYCNTEDVLALLPPGTAGFPFPSIAIEPNTGNAWVAFANRVLRVSPSGQTLLDVTLSKVAVGITFEPQTERIWVAQCKRVDAYDTAGTVVGSLPVRVGSETYLVHSLDYDAALNEIWVGLNNRLRVRRESPRSLSLDLALRGSESGDVGGAKLS